MKRAVANSYGIVPIYLSADGPKVLVVEQYSAQGTHWGFPKGGPEPGERPVDTAIREAREEVSVTIDKVVEGVSFRVVYSFTYKEAIFDKTVEYFIGFVRNPGFARHEKEIKDADWFNFTDARNRLSFMNTRDMFDSVVDYLEEHPDDHI